MRDAFNSYMDCVEGNSGAGQCAAAWAGWNRLAERNRRACAKDGAGHAEYYV